jgi:hypothetical protein
MSVRNSGPNFGSLFGVERKIWEPKFTSTEKRKVGTLFRCRAGDARL